MPPRVKPTIESRRVRESRPVDKRRPLVRPESRVVYHAVFVATLLIREKAFASMPTPGRSSGFRFVLLAEPSRWRLSSIRETDRFVIRRWAVALSGVRPRLQRRDRDGFAPSSLFSPASHELPGHLDGRRNLTSTRRLSKCPRVDFRAGEVNPATGAERRSRRRRRASTWGRRWKARPRPPSPRTILPPGRPRRRRVGVPVRPIRAACLNR